MASYFEYFRINVEGSSDNVNSICEAIKEFAPDCEITVRKKVIEIEDMCKIADEDDACEFVQIIARAANGASFKLEGVTECSVSCEKMRFAAELNDNLVFKNSCWYNEYSPEALEEYDTFEEYEDDIGEFSEEEFKIAKEQFVYIIDGIFSLDVPFNEAICLEY